MIKLINRFVKDEEGATAIEYGLIAALIAVAVITSLTAVGDQLSTNFDEIKTEIDQAETSVT